ncbi:MAG: response regulator transcription factor [Roseiflexaceae bacterium]|nr:response regulator transcription factor [Roseiflexaceae bacterium]
MSERITVLLVDDHAIVRHGVRAFLNLQVDIRVVGEAANGSEAIALAAEHAPHVILMDIVMPGMHGVEATAQIKRVSPHTKVIVLTSYDDDVLPAIKAGALSYLSKDVLPSELVATIRKAAAGEPVLPASMLRRLVRELQIAPGILVNPLDGLTERETAVLRLIGEAHSNAEIAKCLVISETTVKGHVSNILSKLDLTDRTQAAVYAWRAGLMQQSDKGNA